MAARMAVVRFGVFEIDDATGEMRRQGRRVHIAAQPFKTLVLLASRAGDVVSRDELRRHLWGDDTFVEFDRSLNFCVAEIRAALHDDARSPRFIETVPKRGYRFIADAHLVNDEASRRPEGDDDPRDARLTDKDSIYIIGADKLSTELNKLNEETNLDTARLKFDYTYNDERNPERFYYRSDHYNYARHGIPIIFYFTGVHRDYHRPSDVVEKIDFEKMERIDRMIFATGWRVANLDHRLVVDKRP